MRRAFLFLFLTWASTASAQFTIPNYPAATYPAQAGVDEQDIRAIVAGDRGNGVVSGAGCSAQGSPNMTVAVAAGATVFDYTTSAVTSGNATIGTADATNPRFDLVVSAAGTKTVRAGTAAASPLFPTPTAGDVVLCAVYVPASATTITTAQIVDKRIFIAGIKTVTFLNSGTTYTTPIGARLLVIECVGGGGGGGGVTGVASQTATGGGGGGGSYSVAILSGSLSSSYSYAIGAAANGGAAGNNAGTAGNNTTFNTTSCVGKGGAAGSGQAASSAAKAGAASGAGGVAGTGNVLTQAGYPGSSGVCVSGTVAIGSTGGSGPWGGGGLGLVAAGAGNAGSGCGAGGSGGLSTAATSRAGGNGSAGCIRITEFY